jgi:hypothetical protein
MTTHLKQLKLTAVPSGSDPVMDQRMRLIRRLEEQKQLASDPHYVRVTRRWTGKGAARGRAREVDRQVQGTAGGQGRHRRGAQVERQPLQAHQEVGRRRHRDRSRDAQRDHGGLPHPLAREAVVRTFRETYEEVLGTAPVNRTGAGIACTDPLLGRALRFRARKTRIRKGQRDQD